MTDPPFGRRLGAQGACAVNTVKFNFICRAGHDGADINRDGPTITLVSKQWAYCSRGAMTDHDWSPLDIALAIEEIQAKGIAHKALT